MRRDHILALLLIHDSVERGPDLQARIDAARLSWIARRTMFAVLALVVVLSLVGVLPQLLIWPIVLVLGLVVSETEIRLARHATTVHEFDLRVSAFRFAQIVSLGLLVPLIVGPSWLVPIALVVVVASSGTQLGGRALITLVGVGGASYLLGTALIESKVVMPVDPVGLSGSISLPGAVVISVVILPVITGFVFARARRAARSRLELERTVGELQDTELRLRASQSEAQQLSEQLTEEVDRKTEELATRNRALSIVNAISFALSQPSEDETALSRAARLVARLFEVDAVQLRELASINPGVDLIVGAAPDADDLPSLSYDVIDTAIERHEGVTRSAADDVVHDDAYVIVPMVTRGTVRGSLTLIGNACRSWGDQELHLLTLIGREMGAALESARLYRDAVAVADREVLVTGVTALLGDGAPLDQELDELLTRIGEDLGCVFANVSVVDQTSVGAELACWIPDGAAALTAEQFSALVAPIPTPLEKSATPLLIAASYLTTPSIRERFGELLVAPILTAQTETISTVGEDTDTAVLEGSARTPAAILLLAAPPNATWSDVEVDLVVRLASLIGRRLEGEQLVQLQQRRVDELAALAEIGRVIQSGTDTDRLYSDFAVALHRLVPYQHAYIARMQGGTLNQVVVFSQAGRVRRRAQLHEDDSSHGWFNSRESVEWKREVDTPPRFVDSGDASGLTLPMRPKGQLLGAVVIVGEGDQAISARLAERAVEQLSLALDSADLYRQATERASRIEAQRNLANIVASAVDLHGAFDAFAEEVRWLIPFERAVMFTIDPARETVQQAAIYPPAADAGLAAASIETSILSRVLDAGAAIALARSDEALTGLDWSLVGADSVEVVAVPIRDGADTSAIFALSHTGVADYANLDLGALEGVADLLAVTMDRLRLYERAEHAARHDLLTGLPNYRYLQERLLTLKTEFEDDRRSAILMIDMDGLKLYNDTLGHEAGDRAIQRVAEELQTAVRAEDLVARTGGDEFVVVMEDVAEEDALVVAQRMHDSLRDIHREFGNAPVPVRISVGLAFAPDDGVAASELIEAADRAMYAAKFSGGDRTRAAGDHAGSLTARTLRRRGNRVMELLIRSAVDGASGSERLAVALAQRYVVAVALGLGLPLDTADPLRMLVAAEAAHHMEVPEEYRDQQTALMLLDGLRNQWDAQIQNVELDVEELLPAAVRLAWEQIPEPAGPGLTAEQALSIVKNDPAYHLRADVLDLLSQSALTAELERRGSDQHAA